MSAGKIYVSNGPRLPPMELSGFWLMKNFFITCAHFFGLDTPEIDRLSILESLKTEGPTMLRVSSETFSQTMGEQWNSSTLLKDRLNEDV